MAAFSAIRRPSAAHGSRWMLPLWILAATVAGGYLVKEFISAPGSSQGSRSSHPRVAQQVYSQPLRPLVGDQRAPVAEEEGSSWSLLASSVIFGAVAVTFAMLAATKCPGQAADLEAAVRSSLTSAQAQVGGQMRDALYAADTTEAGLRTAAVVAAEDFQKGLQAFQQGAEAQWSGLSPQVEEAARAAQSKVLELSAGARVQMESLSGQVSVAVNKEAALGAAACLTLASVAGSQQLGLGEQSSPAAASPAAASPAKTFKVDEQAQLRNLLLSVRRA